MRGLGEPGRVLARRGLTASGLVVLGVFLRLDLLKEPAIWLGWNSDSAVFGLMAKRIRDGTGFDVFFWGQNYLGPLTSALAALIRRLFLDASGAGAEAGPLSLRLACVAEVSFGTVLSFLAFDRLFGYAAALAGGLWLALSSPVLVRVAAAPMGPEVSFALGSIVFYLTADALTRSPAALDRAAGRFGLGLAGGIGWWMNPTVVLVLVPCALLLVLRSPSYATLLERVVTGSPGLGDAAKTAMRRLAPVATGLAAGTLPVWLGGVLGWYPRAYGFVTPLLPGPGWLHRLGRFFAVDGRRLVGLDGDLSGGVVYVAGLAGVALLVVRRRYRLRSLALLTPFPADGIDLALAVVATGAWVFTLEERLPGQIRYLAPVLPATLAMASAGAVDAVRRVPGRFLRLAAALAAGGLALAGLVVTGRNADREVSEIRAERDPRPLLAEIEQGGWSVCHAGYGIAYKLQFLSDEQVRFVPFQSQDRNPRESARLRELPGPQCLVTPEGSVRGWRPEDAAEEGGPRKRREAGVRPSTPASPGRAPSS